jgi:hypothetical protein
MRAVEAMQPESSNRIAMADSRRLMLAICLILLPIISFYAILARRSVNVPFLDDYNGVLEFLEHFSALPNTWAKVGYVVLTQHNEYKTVFANSIIALQYGISGHPNFVLLSWLGNIFVLALFYLMWRYFLVEEENTSRRLLLFAPVAYLLFQLQYAETLNWSSPGLQNIPVLIFAFAAIAALFESNRRSFVLGCILMMFSIAASGNGFALLPVGIVMLFQKRAWRRLVLWTLTAGICAAVYFYHYNFHSSQQDPNRSVLHSTHYLNPIFTLSFMGSALSFRVPVIKNLSILCGALICVLILLMAKRRFDKSNPAFFNFSAFLVLTAIGVSGIRSKLGIEASLAGRYRIYSDILLICCYVFVMESYLWGHRLQRRLFQAALVASILFWAVFDRHGNTYLLNRDRSIMVGVEQYKISNHEQGPVFITSDERVTHSMNIWARPIMETSESTGLYRLP